MTTAQITAIIGIENLDDRVYVDDIQFISFGKDKNLTFSEQKRVRFFFDTANEILEVSICRPYSTNGSLPTHGQYDTLDYNGVSTVFEYLVNADKTLVVDYYGFEAISLISLRGN